MDLHLKNLFGRFQDQFGSGPGLGPGSGACLMKVDGISPNFVRSMYRASASLYRTEPWRRLRPGHLFGVRVGKDTDWSGKKQPFGCVQFIGGDGGDIAFYMYRSRNDAHKMTQDSRETIRVPKVEVLRVTYELESLMFPSNKRMIKSFSLEVSGTDRFPVIDVALCMSLGELQFRNPTLEELRFVYAVLKAISLVHPLLEEDNKQGCPQWPRMINFVPFIETVDVQWPSEMIKGHDFVAVTVSHPPGQSYEDKPMTSVTTEEDDQLETVVERALVDLRVGSSLYAIFRNCAMCDKSIRKDETISCSHCSATIYCGTDCEKRHWREIHRSVCGLCKAMMDREEELEIKLFNFPCFAENPCEWLESLGIHKKGMWRRKCDCYTHYPFGLLPVSTDARLELWGGLKNREYPQDSPFQNQSELNQSSPILLSGWSEYYDLRSLSLSSPVADILTYPLTVHHILTSLSIRTKNLLLKGKDVSVHYLGPEPELDWVNAFAEIGHLLSGSGAVQITMIGPEVPSDLSGTTATATSRTNKNSRVSVNFVKGLYQDEASYLPSPPDIVIALNCDLDRYLSWGGALEVVKKTGVPGFYTDKTEEACGNTKGVLRNAGLQIAHPVSPNPFRSPVRTAEKSSNLPCYSNAFILGVKT